MGEIIDERECPRRRYMEKEGVGSDYTKDVCGAYSRRLNNISARAEYRLADDRMFRGLLRGCWRVVGTIC